MDIDNFPIDAILNIINGRYDPNPYQIPIDVDDIMVGYIEDGIFYTAEYDNDEPSPCIPDSSKIYIDRSTYDTYKYSDTDKKYIKVSE